MNGDENYAYQNQILNLRLLYVITWKTLLKDMKQCQVDRQVWKELAENR